MTHGTVWTRANVALAHSVRSLGDIARACQHAATAVSVFDTLTAPPGTARGTGTSEGGRLSLTEL